MYMACRLATMMEAYLQPLRMKEQDFPALSLSLIVPTCVHISLGAQQQTKVMPYMSTASQSTMQWPTSIQIYRLTPPMQASNLLAMTTLGVIYAPYTPTIMAEPPAVPIPPMPLDYAYVAQDMLDGNALHLLSTDLSTHTNQYDHTLCGWKASDQDAISGPSIGSTLEETPKEPSPSKSLDHACSKLDSMHQVPAQRSHSHASPLLDLTIILQDYCNPQPIRPLLPNKSRLAS